MRIELPGEVNGSPAWVDIRERLMASDKFKVQDALRISMDQDAVQSYGGGFLNTLRNALLREIITAWAWENIPIPAVNIGGADIIGSTLDIDQYNALAQAVEPLLQKVVITNPNRAASTSSSPSS